jgi:hypothetical protein
MQVFGSGMVMILMMMIVLIVMRAYALTPDEEFYH